MAREYARVKVGIWADSDFRKLSDGAQALYFRLLSSPTMSLCGVADWRPNRLAALTRGMTVQAIRHYAEELTDDGYVVVDDETEEILVRSFVRHDGLIKTPNIAAAMVKDYAGVASESIRGVIIHELVRLHADEPGMKGWVTASKLLSEPAINPSCMPSVKASVNPSVMPSTEASDKALAIPSGNGSHIPQPATIIQQPASIERTAASRARSITADWEPDPEVNAAMRNECPNVDLDAEHRKFVDWWTGTGKPMKDWNAVWRNWIRRTAETGIRNSRPRAGTDIDWDAAAARAAERDRNSA